jgi:hypothetical protein
MLKIAAEFERGAMWDMAWRAYAEAIYAGYGPAWPDERARETWLSAEAAGHWSKAAACAQRAGKTHLAENYFVKAAVFGGDKTQETLKGVARRWSESPTSHPAPVDDHTKREALTRIVDLYVEINAHPRALQVIDANGAVFDDPDTLRKKVEDQWLAIVKDASRAAEKVVLYGHEVYPQGDPLKIRIPWAFSDEAVVSVRNRLKAVDTNGTNP